MKGDFLCTVWMRLNVRKTILPPGEAGAGEEPSWGLILNLNWHMGFTYWACWTFQKCFPHPRSCALAPHSPHCCLLLKTPTAPLAIHCPKHIKTPPAFYFPHVYLGVLSVRHLGRGFYWQKGQEKQKHERRAAHSRFAKVLRSLCCFWYLVDVVQPRMLQAPGIEVTGLSL